jgi:hypothetical protein
MVGLHRISNLDVFEVCSTDRILGVFYARNIEAMPNDPNGGLIFAANVVMLAEVDGDSVFVVKVDGFD